MRYEELLRSCHLPRVGSGNADKSAHKHADELAQRIGKNGYATGATGTISLSQAKAIAARAIGKATGGTQGGGRDCKDIQTQLDEHFKVHNETLLRGLKDARRVTDETRDAINPTGPLGD